MTTREQIEAARRAASIAVARCDMSHITFADLRTLLAASAEPTDEQLCAEFDALVQSKGWDPRELTDGELAWYADGARREGRR